jgi:hypothetical protein
MNQLQDLYGAYPEESRIPDYVMAYLKRDIDEKKLTRLFRFITYSHPVRFGPPGIAAIEKSINDALYRKKGEDVHKNQVFTTGEEMDFGSEEEYQEGVKLLKEKGGLSNMLEELTSKKRWNHK